MKRSHQIAGILALTCVVALVAILAFLPGSDSSPPQMVLSLSGYTNLPNTSRNFAIFTISNFDKSTLQVRGASVQFEGEENFRAPIFHRNFLPKFPRLLKCGDSQIIILGDPGDFDRPARMRLLLDCARFGLKQKLFNFGPRRPLLSLRPSGQNNKLRLYLWRWGLPFIVDAPHIYSTRSEWLLAPYAPQTAPPITNSESPTTRH